MRILVFILPFLISSLFAESTIYTSSDFVLHLKEDSNFVFYPKELSLKTNVAGHYFTRNDSLILTTHEVNKEKAIFAIYGIREHQLELLHFQKEFALSLPSNFHITKTYYSNNALKEDYRWTNINRGSYELYSFNEEQQILSVEKYENDKLNGPQYYYFDNQFAALESEQHYKEGGRHGKSYYFEALDESYLQVQLIKEEKYKEGRLVKTKTPVIPPVFYTSHF